MTFNDLNLDKQLLQALTNLGFNIPTPIQAKAFPIIMSGTDVVGIAQTGTGKTYAYLLPLLKQLKYSDQPSPRILIVVPTRELVLQVVEEVSKLTTYKSVRCIGVYGGTNINTQKDLVHKGVDIIVGTPGRLIDLVLDRILKLSTIQKLVIDEVDELFDLGFRPQMANLMDMLPAKRQNLMFSATLTEDVELLIKSYFSYPQFLEIGIHGAPLNKIIQSVYYVPNFYSKLNLLETLLVNKDLLKVIVFVGNKKIADRLAEELNEKNADSAGIIHSNKSQNQRIAALKKFEDGAHRLLIATDVAARGLDVTNITHVINFDTPEFPENYLHRIGRTGRADKEGIAITFANETEQAYVTEIEKLMDKPIPVQTLPEGLVISNELIKEERPLVLGKNFSKKIVTNIAKGAAFHEKKGKNKKVNLGGPGKIKDRKGLPSKRNTRK